MATANEVRATLDVLCGYYRDKDNQPRQLADVQKAVYLDGLSEYTPEQLETAARAWIRSSRWFPALSDLRALLTEPSPDWKALAIVAWTTFERAVSRAGVYRGVTFADPAIGECVRQTFGSWEHACSYERDSPGWTIRRQTFVALFPEIARKASTPVTLRGISQRDQPLLIAHVEGFPEPTKLLDVGDKSAESLREVERRFTLLQIQKTEASHEAG
jgi:hypothetical protein